MFSALSTYSIPTASAQPAGHSGVFARPSRRKGRTAFTLVEVMVAMSVLVIVAVAVTQALLQINRRAAIARVMNAAKAEALSRIQQVSQISYAPDASPAVIPTLLTTNSVTQVDLGSKLTGLGSIPATATWSVAPTAANSKIISVTCEITYNYLSRQPLHYKLVTYKSPD